jgi:peptide/nickel transport system substrate-binding protein
VPQNPYCLRYMPFNFDSPNTAGRIIHQTYFRQALQRCVDQDRMVEEIYHGYAHAGTGPVPRVPDSELVSPAQRAMATPFDLDEARALLAANGWDVSTIPATCVRGGEGAGCAGAGIAAGDRLSFSLRYVEGREVLRRMMEMVVADAAEVGIELRLEAVHGSVMVGQDHSERGTDHRDHWEINCWNGGWAFYGDLTGEMLFKTRAASNYGQYGDATADALIEETVVSTDLDAMHRYQDYLAAQVPVVWMPGFPLRLFEVARNLRGIEPINLYGVINPENWYYVARQADRNCPPDRPGSE